MGTCSSCCRRRQGQPDEVNDEGPITAQTPEDPIATQYGGRMTGPGELGGPIWTQVFEPRFDSGFPRMPNPGQPQPDEVIDEGRPFWQQGWVERSSVDQDDIVLEVNTNHPKTQIDGQRRRLLNDIEQRDHRCCY
jgi:hypothetical protein